MAQRTHRAEPIPYEELALGHPRQAHIEALWQYRASSARRQLVLPDGRMDLVAHGVLAASGEVSGLRLAIAGPADRPCFVNMPAGTVATGIRLRVGWGGPCLGLQAASLRNRVVVGEAALALIGPAAQAVLRARRIDELQRALVDTACAMGARALPSTGFARVLQAVQWLRQGVPLAALGARTGTTARTLRRDVDDCVGLPLRTLAGILRFQQAMARLHAGAAPTLGDLAAEAGYADQAHMTRAFRRFGMFTPALPVAAPVVEALGAHPVWPQRSRPEATAGPHSAGS